MGTLGKGKLLKEARPRGLNILRLVRDMSYTSMSLNVKQMTVVGLEISPLQFVLFEQSIFRSVHLRLLSAYTCRPALVCPIHVGFI